MRVKSTIQRRLTKAILLTLCIATLPLSSYASYQSALNEPTIPAVRGQTIFGILAYIIVLVPEPERDPVTHKKVTQYGLVHIDVYDAAQDKIYRFTTEDRRCIRWKTFHCEREINRGFDIPNASRPVRLNELHEGMKIDITQNQETWLGDRKSFEINRVLPQ